jgi:hypothetical protein
MTNRERWTVYPLLFLTLGIVLKDKLTKWVNADRVNANVMVCKTLVVTDRAQQERVFVTLAGTGRQGVPDESNQRFNVLLGHSSQVDGFVLADAKGNLRSPSFQIRLPDLRVPDRVPNVTETPEAPAAPPADNQETDSPLPEEAAK